MAPRKKEMDAATKRLLEEAEAKERARLDRLNRVNEALASAYEKAEKAFADLELKSDDPGQLAKRLSARFTWLQFNLSYRGWRCGEGSSRL